MTQLDLEHRYYEYLYSKGYSSNEALQQVLRWYLRYFQGFHRVLDIGCGNGEFLRLLQEAGHEAVGVDIDPAMVAQCQAQGLTAYTADVLIWLPTQAGQYDAIFSSNVIEHLDAKTVLAVVEQAYQALRPGGFLLLGTPNPESAIVQFHEYWRDPTHVRLYSRQLLEFFLHSSGFTEVQSDVNRETHWEGIDEQLQSLQAVPSNNQTDAPTRQHHRVAELHPLPPPPGPQAAWGERARYRLLHFVFQKFLEPYLALVRLDLEHHRQHIVQLEEQVAWLQERLTTLHGETLRHQQQIQQLGHSARFLYPAREIFVYGYKPTDQPLG
ncbi:MAG: methyltransferase domain-containing protein [Caldilineaceae bacterium]|nr:methyltransferase domain-containing protein [Caldilineaceae bacterium]